MTVNKLIPAALVVTLLTGFPGATPAQKKPAAPGEKKPDEKKPAAVTVPDKNLEAAVRAVLQEPKAPLTEETLNKVFVLEAPGKGIAKLDGLEKCKNLALLNVSNNQVAGLAPLQGLTNLQSLDLSKNKVTDV